MSGYWINSKGKKFVGDAGIVPAADDMNPNVVSYDEWMALEIGLIASSEPSELLNDDVQVVPFIASMISTEELQEWTYDMAVSVAGIEGAQILNIVKTDTGIEADLELPVDVVEGDVATITCMSGGRVGTLAVTVVA